MASRERQLKNSLVYLFAVVAGNVVAFVTLPVFTRFISREEYGVLALVQAYAIFMGGVASFGMPIIYERNYFEHHDIKRIAALLYSTLLFTTVLFTFLASVTYFFRGVLAQWVTGSAAYGPLLFLAFCANGITSLKAYYLTYYKNTENAKKFVWYTIDEIVLSAVIALLLVVGLGFGITGIVWGQAIAGLVVFLIVTTRFVKELPPTLDWGILKEVLKLSYPLTPRFFVGVVGNQADKYMLRFLDSVGGVGVYSIGQKIANVVFTCMTAIQNVYAPQVYQRMFNLGELGKEAVGRYLTPFAYLSMFMALLVGIFAEEMTWLLLAPAYRGAADVVLILSLYYAIMFFGKQPQLLFAKKTLTISLLTFLSIGLTIAITIPLIIKFGMLGAAWGTLVSGGISITISFYVSQRAYRIGWEYRKIVIFIALLSALVLGLLILRWIHAGYLIRFLYKITILVMYGYFGVRFRILTGENYQSFKSMIMGLRLVTTGGSKSVNV
ncbi:oligosaccharide flippase family protein [Candidatus Uhrbacteria bacterium]|nr:oligosaccharide flippase family protein [Candidatus Uhrbacteria bacterium]